MNDKKIYVIGVDNGNGSVKTASSNWFSGVKKVKSSLCENVLEYRGTLYELGERPSEYFSQKYLREDLRIQTLAAIATELEARNVCDECPKIHLALGLPIEHWTKQKELIKEYFSKNVEEKFKYKGKLYHISIRGCNVIPQGLASTRKYRPKECGNIISLDIGFGTLDYLVFHNGVLSMDESGSLEYGVSKCYEKVRKAVGREFSEEIDFFSFDNYVRGKRGLVTKEWHSTIDSAIKEYCKTVISEAKRVGYNPATYVIHLLGGGSNIMKTYAELEENDATFDLDIRSNAKCFEAFCKQVLRKQGVEFNE